MRTKEELQFDIDSQQLVTNEIKSRLNLADRAQIQQFKRRIRLAYHPDKKIGALEKEKYTALFQAMQPFLNIDDRIESRIEKLAQSFTHEYCAEATEGNTLSRISQTFTFNFNVPFIKQTTLLSNALKDIYQLTDNDINDVNEKFKTHVASFVKQLLSIKKPSPFGLMFFSHDPIETDLLLLISASHDEGLMQQINRLKSSTISYDNFSNDCASHSTTVLKLIEDCLARKEFHENVYKVYLNIASQQKEPPIHGIWKKETYAYLTGLLFKIPAFIALMCTLLATIFFVLLPIGIFASNPIGLFTLCAASTIASLALAAWVSSLAAAFYFEINPFDVIEKTTMYTASFVDGFVDYLFTPKFFATELASNLADFTTRTSKNQTSAHHYQGSFFEGSDSNHGIDSNESRSNRCY